MFALLTCLHSQLPLGDADDAYADTDADADADADDAGPVSSISNHHSADLKRHKKPDPLEPTHKASLCLHMTFDIRGCMGNPAG